MGIEADQDYSIPSVKNSVIDLPQLRTRTTYFQAVETDVLHYWRMILIAVHPLLLQACPAIAAAVQEIIDFATCHKHCFQAEAADHAAVAVEAVAVTAQSNFAAVVIAAFEDLVVERRHHYHYQAAVDQTLSLLLLLLLRRDSDLLLMV